MSLDYPINLDDIQKGTLFRTRDGHIAKIVHYDTNDTEGGYPWQVDYLGQDVFGNYVTTDGCFLRCRPDHEHDLVERLVPTPSHVDKPMLLVVAGQEMNDERFTVFQRSLTAIYGQRLEVVVLPHNCKGWIYTNGTLQAHTFESPTSVYYSQPSTLDPQPSTHK